MNLIPEWERAMRKRHPKGSLRVKLPAFFYMAFIMAFIMAAGYFSQSIARSQLPETGAGVAMAIFGGWMGWYWRMALLSASQNTDYLLIFIPAPPALIERHNRRLLLPLILSEIGLVLLLSGSVGHYHHHYECIPAVMIGMMAGYFLCTQKIGRLLGIALVLSVISSFVCATFLGYDGNAITFLIFTHTSVPAWPWLLAIGIIPPWKGIILLILLVIASHDHLQAAKPRKWPTMDLDAFPTDENVGGREVVNHSPIEDTELIDEKINTRRRWTGIAEFTASAQLSYFDKLLRKWLSSRQKWMSSMDCWAASKWFRRTLYSIPCLLVSIGCLFYENLLENVHWLPAPKDPFLLIIPGLISTGLAVVLTMPFTSSSFGSWVSRFPLDERTHSLMLAYFPVTAREWLAAVWKEWLARSAWSSLIWSMAIWICQSHLLPMEPLPYLACLSGVMLFFLQLFPSCQIQLLFRELDSSSIGFLKRLICRVLEFTGWGAPLLEAYAFIWWRPHGIALISVAVTLVLFFVLTICLLLWRIERPQHDLQKQL